MSNKLRKIAGKTALYLKKSSPTILTGLSVVGIILTTVATAKATVKAVKIIEESENKKGEELTVSEKIAVAAPLYFPVTIFTAATIFCVVSANVLNKRQTASYISAYTLLESSYKQYKSKVKEMYGEDADREVEKAITKDEYKEKDIPETENKLLFYEPFSKQFFERTKEEVLLAEYHLNRNFALRGSSNLNELYSFLDLPKTDFGDNLGWSMDAGLAFYGYSWIDFEHEAVIMDDGRKCCVITMPFMPTADYEDDPFLW